MMFVSLYSLVNTSPAFSSWSLLHCLLPNLSRSKVGVQAQARKEDSTFYQAVHKRVFPAVAILDNQATVVCDETSLS